MAHPFCIGCEKQIPFGNDKREAKATQKRILRYAQMTSLLPQSRKSDAEELGQASRLLRFRGVADLCGQDQAETWLPRSTASGAAVPATTTAVATSMVCDDDSACGGRFGTRVEPDASVEVWTATGLVELLAMSARRRRRPKRTDRTCAVPLWRTRSRQNG